MTLRTLTSLGATFALAACVSAAPPRPAAMVYPGKNKTTAAFQQDQAICQQHAVSQSGYGTIGSVPAGTAPTSASEQGQPTTDENFMQCMASRGDTVQMMAPAQTAAIGTPYAYGPSYAYGTPYPYPGYSPNPYAYPGYGLALGGLGFFGGYGLSHGFHHDGFHHDGFHGFHHDGFHGGGFHQGFHHNGFHGGGFHGGGFRGGFHGGGGHGGGHH